MLQHFVSPMQIPLPGWALSLASLLQSSLSASADVLLVLCARSCLGHKLPLLLEFPLQSGERYLRKRDLRSITGAWKHEFRIQEWPKANPDIKNCLKNLERKAETYQCHCLCPGCISFLNSPCRAHLLPFGNLLIATSLNFNIWNKVMKKWYSHFWPIFFHFLYISKRFCKIGKAAKVRYALYF